MSKKEPRGSFLIFSLEKGNLVSKIGSLILASAGTTHGGESGQCEVFVLIHICGQYAYEIGVP